MNTFRNEPLLELRRGAVRTECLTALAALDAKLPLEVPMLIGEDVVTGQVFASVDPSDPKTILADEARRGGAVYLVRDGWHRHNCRPDDRPRQALGDRPCALPGVDSESFGITLDDDLAALNDDDARRPGPFAKSGAQG